MARKFKTGECLVYPTHGVGRIVEIENTVVAGMNFECYKVRFEKERLTLSVPLSQVEKIGARALSTIEEMDNVFEILRSGTRKMKGMWSRRAQEYEEKINSGSVKLVAEVLRDLVRDIEDADRSYSERVIYELALYRLSSEYMYLKNITIEEAKEEILTIAKEKLILDEDVEEQELKEA